MYDESKYASGYTIFGSAEGNYSAVIDKYGNEIWNSGNDNIIYSNFLEDGQFFAMAYCPDCQYPYIGTEFSFTAGIIWQEPNEEYFHHEFMELPWGDYMGIGNEFQLGPIHATGDMQISFQSVGYEADGITNEWSWQGDRLVIWDKDTKEVIWTWSTFDHFSMADFNNDLWESIDLFIDNYYDWTHVDAFYFDNTDNSIFISTRNLSRITKIDYPSGEIIWNMGHGMPSGDVTFGHDIGFSYQNGLDINEGNIVFFDNGNYAAEYWGADGPTSRALEIAVLGSAGDYSASIAFEYILPDDLFGSISGNVQQLHNGNYLITTIADGGTTLEVTPEKEIVWEANYGSNLIWRASRIPPSCPTGDINGDTIYNVLDIVMLANCVLATNCEEYGCAADMNDDDNYNVLDIVILANCVLDQDCGG